MPDHLEYSIQEIDFYNIIHNLIENAAKYSAADSCIQVSLTRNVQQITFKVADQGIGIAPENRDKVFDRFYREDDSHSNKIAGSGLGLAIVKAEVMKYHGQITIADNLPQGTIFTVNLPIEK